MPGRPRPSRTAALSTVLTLALVAVLSLGALFLLRSPAGDGGDAGAPSEAPPAFLYAEFGPGADRIYRSPATDPAKRELVDTVPHAPGWGIFPAPETAAGRAAFTVLPPDGPASADAPAEVWVLDLDASERTRLARDADLLVAPVLRRDGEALVYRRTGPGDRQALVQVDIDARTRAEVHAESTTFGIFPAGFDDEGALLFARLSPSGTDFYRVREGAEPELLFHASDEIARDWRVSPDGRAVSFLAPEVTGERVLYRARVVALDGTARDLPVASDVAGEQYGPSWLPDGSALAVGQEPLVAEQSGAALLAPEDGRVSLLEPPDRGFDVPLAWSSGGEFLAVRSFDGTNSHRPGEETLVIVGSDGTRRAARGTSELIFIGWDARA